MRDLLNFDPPLQLEPDAVRPHWCWLAVGDRIAQLPEASDGPPMFLGHDKGHFVGIHPDCTALVVFRSEEIGPTVLKRLAPADWWSERFGDDWWFGEKAIGVLAAVISGMYTAGIVHFTELAWARRSFPIEHCWEISTSFEPMVTASAQRSSTRLRLSDYVSLLNAPLLERLCLVGGWLPAAGLAMVFAERGVGKTLFVLEVAYAAASGGSYLTWQAPRPRRVLVIDGEMPAADIKKRVSDIIARSGQTAPPENLVILSADMHESGLPDISTKEGQQEIEPYLAGFDLIILDNISTLLRTGVENDAESWSDVQLWLLSQRRAGRSVLLVHHAGKGGAQRGTSRREDALDTVIQLKRPPGYTAREGARFEVHFTKARGVIGSDTEPLEVALKDGCWTYSRLSAAQSDDYLALHESGLTVREIAEMRKVSVGTVSAKLNGRGNGRGRPKKPGGPPDA